MKAVKGNKQIEVTLDAFQVLVKKYTKVVIDLGTGDGKFVYESARKNDETLYIGIDPSARQLEIYSKQANKKHLENALFIIGSVELLPNKLTNIADELHIILPWGTLLQTIVKPIKSNLIKVAELMKQNSNLYITLGYDEKEEPNETQRLQLPEISEKYILEEIVPQFSEIGFTHIATKKLDITELKELDTTWGKKLTFGKSRPVFEIQFKKN